MLESSLGMSFSPLPVWPVTRLVIFDCDSTLSSIEGIDELARLSGRQEDVALSIAALTKRAMEGDLPLEAVYGQRLTAVNPTQAEVAHIASIYRQTVVLHAAETILALQTLGAEVFIVSGGMLEPVRDFGVWLGVPSDHIFAVSMEYDQLAGAWWRYWDQPGGRNPRASYLSLEANPLTAGGGKKSIITRLRAEYPGRAMLIGDGLSDLEARSEVELFIGFGGVVHRPQIAELSPVYIQSASLAPVLPLALGQLGNAPRFAGLWAEGLRRIQAGEVLFNDPSQHQAFITAMRRTLVHPLAG